MLFDVSLPLDAALLVVALAELEPDLADELEPDLLVDVAVLPDALVPLAPVEDAAAPVDALVPLALPEPPDASPAAASSAPTICVGHTASEGICALPAAISAGTALSLFISSLTVTNS